MNQCDLAWAAGFFDGEGSFSAWDSSPRYHYIKIRLIIAQVPDKVALGEEYSSLLEKFELIFREVKFYHRLDTRRSIGTNKQHCSYIEACSFESVQYITCLMWPWLGQPKKDQYLRCAKEYLRLA